MENKDRFYSKTSISKSKMNFLKRYLFNRTKFTIRRIEIEIIQEKKS